MTRLIAGIVGIVGIVGCGATSETGEPTNSQIHEPTNSTNAPKPGGSTVVVHTAPGRFVWLEPSFAHEFPPAEGAAYMDQQGQMFIPETLLARVGQPVHFRSSEDVLHNVRVIRSDRKPIFNVVTPPFGSYTHTFDEPGLYTVTCDIHATMRATVYVASMPYVGTADEHGRFTFEHVVPGTYTVAGFADATPIEKTVEIAGKRVDVSLR
jgi:plastocyanin